MIFTPGTIEGVWAIDLERHTDERGFFARTWCRREFAARGLEAELAQCSLSYSERQGTLRGMHYQEAPHAEAKLVRCVAGSVYDVVIDLRPYSATHLQHMALELDAAGGRALYVPQGCAHGFQTLEDATQMLYQMSHPYVPEAGRGVRWNDPAFSIRWPQAKRILSTRDACYADFAVSVPSPVGCR